LRSRGFEQVAKQSFATCQGDPGQNVMRALRIHA
jgi:hypothetical protein